MARSSASTPRIFSPTGGSVGIAFAIPASLARDVVADLEDDGKVARGWLGVQIQRVDKDIAASVGLDRPRGAIVAAVVAGGPAAEAGLEPGDVILGVNGAAVETMRELPRRVAALPAGEKAELDLWRDGRATAATVEIGALPTGEEAAARSAAFRWRPARRVSISRRWTRRRAGASASTTRSWGRS